MVDKKLFKAKNAQHEINQSFNWPQASSNNNLNKRSFYKAQLFPSEQNKNTWCELCTRGHKQYNKQKTCDKFKKLNIS